MGCYIGRIQYPLIKPVTLIVESADDIKKAIEKGLQTHESYMDVHSELSDILAEGLIIELANGTEVSIDVITRGSWAVSCKDLRLSDSMFEKDEGDHLVFKFGNAHHTALFRLRQGHVKKVSNAALDSLINIGLVEGTRTTRKGILVLDKIWAEAETKNPIMREDRVMTFARALIENTDPCTPAFHWARENEYVAYVNRYDRPREPWYRHDFHFDFEPEPLEVKGYFYPTIKGAKWLEDHISQILKHQSCSDKRRKQLLEFLPEAYLPKYLTHDDALIRHRAALRHQTLNSMEETI